MEITIPSDDNPSNVTRRQRTVSFAENSDLNTAESGSQILSESVSAKIDENLRSIDEEYFATPGDNESSPLLESFTRKLVDSLTNPETATVRKLSFLESVHGGAGWISAAFLLMSAALGSGLLNYPVAYDRLGGVWLSTVAQLIILIILSTTMLILIYCSDLNQSCSYHEVLQFMCGKRTQQLAAVSVMASCFGICITFLIIIGDQFDRIFATFIGPQFCYEWYFNRYFSISLTSLCLIWPMSYFKRLDFLKYFNLLGIFAMFYVVFLNIYEYFMLDVMAGPLKTGPDSILTVFAALPVICFAYQSHEIVVPVYACMSERKISSFAKATALALSVLFILYCLSGSFGYSTFGSNVSADVMQMYDPKDPVVAAGVIALIVKMITTYPQVVFCGRDTFTRLFFNELREESVKKEFWHRISITTIWNSVVLLLSIITPNITISIGFLGSLAALNGFIFPGLCMVSLARRQLNIISSSALLSKLMLCYGVFVILTGSFMFVNILIQAVNDLQTYSYDSLKLCQ